MLLTAWPEVYYKRGNYRKLIVYTQVLQKLEKIFGKDHPNYASSLETLGLLSENMGEYDRAEQYYLEAMDIRCRILGREHPYYLKSLNRLASFYAKRGESEKAEQFRSQAKETQSR